MMLRRGPTLAVLSAALFGMSPVLVKVIGTEMSPVLIAALLYLGSGMGLGVVQLRSYRLMDLQALKNLPAAQKQKLVGATVSGGILAPLCLGFAIQSGTAFEVSLLLNLETVATTLIAWLIFHENVGVRLWLGKVLIVIGAVVATVQSGGDLLLTRSAVYILGACLFWGIDNNLTRDIEDISPVLLASVKGWVAGGFNLVLALALGVGLSITFLQGLSVLFIGAICYGASLVFFVKALRDIGSARTSTYFSSGPFFGMFGALLLLGERPTSFQWISVFVMTVGVWVLYGERHLHSHTHERICHSHSHSHDDGHHNHDHDHVGVSEVHEHEHVHEPVTHTHLHQPDIHHRHKH